VLGFAMGPYGCMERTWKPFNPILGETFELDMDKGVRFFAEQVQNDCCTALVHGMRPGPRPST
jgi:Oxysterol-binding protein